MSNSIVFIVKARHLFDTLYEIMQKHGLEYPIFYGKDVDECFTIAKEQVRIGAKVLVSTDYVTEYFMKHLHVSIVTIRRSGYSFISRVAEELAHTDKVGILSRVGGYTFSQAAEEARKVNPSQVYSFNYTDEAHARSILTKLKASGFSSIICPSWIGALVEELNMKYVYVRVPEKDVVEAIRHAEFQMEVLRRQMLHESIINQLLNSSSEGIVAFDETGIIVSVNNRACQLLGAVQQDVQGKHFSDTPFAVFNKNGAITNHTPLQRDVISMSNQLIVFSLQSITVDEKMQAQVVNFYGAQQIKDSERYLRLKELKKGSVATASFSSIIGISSAITKTIRQASRYATVNSTVLITAPSGCGKELFAQSIHNASARAGEAFVVINCAALPESVLESLLFGYEAGTFTGGKREGKAGLFEMAHLGTVFLDEVSEMPLNIQSRFLRVLQEREVVRIGGSKSIPIDVRILAATNRDIWSHVQSGSFREDLYHRISTLLLEIPPLSERKEDIAPLSEYFIRKRSGELGLAVKSIDSAALDMLSTIPLTGNVRELNNILERAMVLAESDILTAEDIRHALPKHTWPKQQEDATKTPPAALCDGTREAEKDTIQRALSAANGSRTKAAGILNISTSTLWRKMKHYNLT